MKRRFTPQEQVLIGLGALVVLLLLVYAGWRWVTSDSFGAAQTSLINAEGNYNDAVAMRRKYEQDGRQIEDRKRRIAQADPDFDLPTFIGGVEEKLAFHHGTVPSEVRSPFAGDKYLLTRVAFTYTGKSLDEIVRFLSHIENPEHGIIINRIKIEADAGTGTKFTMGLTVSAITELRTEP
jgi:hypothetical protein